MVSGLVFLFETRLMLLIHHNQTQVGHRSKDGRTSPHNHAAPSLGNFRPLVQFLPGFQPTVQKSDR